MVARCTLHRLKVYKLCNNQGRLEYTGQLKEEIKKMTVKRIVQTALKREWENGSHDSELCMSYGTVTMHVNSVYFTIDNGTTHFNIALNDINNVIINTQYIIVYFNFNCGNIKVLF